MTGNAVGMERGTSYVAPPDAATKLDQHDPLCTPAPILPANLPAPGTQVGKYELIRELSRGGMGTVFLARDTKLGRRVAIKFLQCQSPELDARFILEARATAQFQHENIVVIYEADEYQGSLFMVLEYLQGSPLSAALQDGRSLSPKKTVNIMIAVARALERAHARNIVHRDLKPDNIFLTDAGTVKVLDFGIAKLLHARDSGGKQASPHAMATMLLAELPAREQTNNHGPMADSSRLTRHGAILGTLPYMSPEQWGVSPVDHRSDIWACGILLFRMLAGRHPLYPATGTELVITAMLDQPMPRARQAIPDIPEELAELIDRCLIKDKARRLASATELLHALEELAPGHQPRNFRADQTPYAGLSSFQESDAARFFGRNEDIAAAVARLQKQPLMGVIGPSGVGKSSFVRAGVVPALKQSGESWSTVVLRPGRAPVSALAQAIEPMVSLSGTGDAASMTSMTNDLAELQAVQERLYREPGYMGVVLRRRARRKDHKLLLFVDQFEELYTLVADPDERMTFTRCLASVADDATAPVRVVISIRSDFLDRVPEDQHFMAELAQGLFFLTPPGRRGLRDALIQPADMVGFQFETTAMVEHMLDHLQHTPGALPLLQFAASKLWELRDQENRLLSDESYRRIGGISGALASHADAVLAELPPSSQTLARTVFLRLVTPERTRALVTVTELHELRQNPVEVQCLLDRLVHARLIVMSSGDGSGTATAEIVHESLLQSWPLLRKWLDENQDDAVLLEQLRNAARQWQAKGYPQGLLWRGEAMEEARLWHRRYRGELPDLQQRYLAEVFALADRAGRRKRNISIAVMAFLGLLVAAAAVALVVISSAQKTAMDAQRQAASEALAARAAEAQVREQIEEVKRARESEAIERKKAEQANLQLTGANRQLLAAIAEAQAARQTAEEARERAENAKRRARRDRKKAKHNETLARMAEARARQANDDLELLLERERERNRQLEEQAGTTTVIEDIPIPGRR